MSALGTWYQWTEGDRRGNNPAHVPKRWGQPSAWGLRYAQGERANGVRYLLAGVDSAWEQDSAWA